MKSFTRPAPVTVKHFFKEGASPASASSSSPTRDGLPRRSDGILGNRDRITSWLIVSVSQYSKGRFNPASNRSSSLSRNSSRWRGSTDLLSKSAMRSASKCSEPCVQRPALAFPLDKELCMVAAQPFLDDAFHLKNLHHTGLQGGPIFLLEDCIRIAFQARCVETKWMSSALRHLFFNDCQWTELVPTGDFMNERD